MRVLAVNDDLPIRTFEPVHSGKVRAVYWLIEAYNRRLIRERQYPVPETAELAVMVISDRLSAFECMWRAEGGLDGVPGKGAALNAIYDIGLTPLNEPVWPAAIFWKRHILWFGLCSARNRS